MSVSEGATVIRRGQADDLEQILDLLAHYGCPVRQEFAHLPTTRQQPRDQAHKHARTHHEEHRAAYCGDGFTHAHASLSGSLKWFVCRDEEPDGASATAARRKPSPNTA